MHDTPAATTTSGRPLRAWRASVALVCMLASALTPLAGCSAGSGSPFASFETRCDKLPAAQFDIVSVPLQVEEIDSQDIAALTVRSNVDAARHRTLGLTTVSFGHETHSELHMMEERASGRACGRPTVHVTVSMQPVVVYLASELRDKPCERNATRAHEWRHVDAYREMLARSAERLRAELPATVGAAPRTAASGGELRRSFDAELRTYLARFMSEQQAAMVARQSSIDTPEEYARVAHACDA